MTDRRKKPMTRATPVLPEREPVARLDPTPIILASGLDQGQAELMDLLEELFDPFVFGEP